VARRAVSSATCQRIGLGVPGRLAPVSSSVSGWGIQLAGRSMVVLSSLEDGDEPHGPTS